MRTYSLQSGSCGNCYHYESGDIKLLFDAGITFRCVQERLAVYSQHAEGYKGLFISHDHSDHTSCAGVMHRKLRVPIFSSRDTYDVMRPRLGKIAPGHLEYFTPGDTVTVGHVKVTTIPTPHDAVNPCAFVVDDGHYRVGILTDIGQCFPGLKHALANLDVVFLESNYDRNLLERNPRYTPPLKRRISGGHGHLENTQCGETVRDYASDRLKVLLLSHLSGDNNNPTLALKTAKSVLQSRGDLLIEVASRTKVSPLIDNRYLTHRRTIVQGCLFEANPGTLL